MFGHKKNFIYGYIFGTLHNRLIRKDLKPGDVHVFEIAIPAKYYLPERLIEKHPVVMLCHDTKISAYKKFKRSFKSNITELLNNCLNNFINKSFRVTNSFLHYSEEFHMPMYRIEVTRFEKGE